MYNHEVIRPKSTGFNTFWPPVADDDEVQSAFRSYLKSRRLDHETAYLNGWYPSRMGCLRVVIPCLSLKQDHAYYQARALSPKIGLRYVSPSGQRHGALCVVDPVQLGYEEEAVQVTAIVEGPMDALALAGLGVPSIALMGIRPDNETLHHLRTLLQARKHVAAIVFDNEDEAQAMAFRLGFDLAVHGIASRTFRTKEKDVADSTDQERQTLRGRIFSWLNKPRLSTSTSE